MTLELPDEAATARLAARLAELMPPGGVLLLQGPLGAGKTTLVRHLARALGFSGRVTSPTYTLMHPYPTPKGTLLHVDLYRLERPETALDLGLLDAMEDARLTAIEWGPEALFPEALVLVLEPTGETTRRVQLKTQNPALRPLIEALS